MNYQEGGRYIDNRSQILGSLIADISREPFQATYRGRRIDPEITGWAQRLTSYFWPSPDVDYRKTARVLGPWFEEAGRLSDVLLVGGSWSERERARAAELAYSMLEWGRVTRQKEFSPDTVERVFRRALGVSSQWAPMSSGWSKVAALATAYLEGRPDVAPHVIWDSRVSSSLVRRLDKMLAERQLDPKASFPGIGPVAGRGGSRAHGLTLQLKWAHAYGSWRAQVAGSELVREVRDLLNASGLSMPLPDEGTGKWTIRGVESVLFMDGY